MSTAKLIALRDAINRCLPIAHLDDVRVPHQKRLFASAEGLALVNAAYDLFEVDELYGMARDVAIEIESIAIERSGLDPEERSEVYCRVIGGGL